MPLWRVSSSGRLWIPTAKQEHTSDAMMFCVFTSHRGKYANTRAIILSWSRHEADMCMHVWSCRKTPAPTPITKKTCACMRDFVQWLLYSVLSKKSEIISNFSWPWSYPKRASRVGSRQDPLNSSLSFHLISHLYAGPSISSQLSEVVLESNSSICELSWVGLEVTAALIRLRKSGLTVTVQVEWQRESLPNDIQFVCKDFFGAWEFRETKISHWCDLPNPEF